MAISRWVALSLVLGLLRSSNADTSVADLVAELKDATTQVARLALLKDSDFVFDFINPPAGSGETSGDGGHTVAASSSNFPALIGNDMASTVGFLGPCGVNTPHTHPRATEFNYITNGTLTGGLLAENGAKFVLNNITTNQATIFPMGAIHFEFNPTCEPVTFVAFFNDVDPGVVQLAQRFFGLPTEVVDAALGGTGVMQIAQLSTLIPDNILQGLGDCKKICGITENGRSFLQQQPRVSGNAFPSDFSHSTPAPSSTATSQKSSPSNNPSGSKEDISGALSDDDSNPGPFSSDNKNRPLIIGLIAAVGVMALGYVALAVAACCRRRSGGSKSRGAYVRTGEDYAPRGLGEREKFGAGPSSVELRTPYDPPSGAM